MTPKYAIGDKFYIATTESERRNLDCPDCLGEKVFKVLAPSGDEFTTPCVRCSADSWGRDVPSLTYNHHVAKVIECEIGGYCVNEYGENGVKYKAKNNGYSVAEASLIADREVAQSAAEAMAARKNAEDEATPARIHHKHLGALKIKEAALDQFKNGLYDSWGAFRHLREAVDSIIENEDHDYGSRDDIVSSLEDRLSTTHRYDFVFKGFARAMEAVVHLVNADAEQEPVVLAALREQWKALPEDAQKAWQPHDKIKTDWSGKPLPVY